jgi:hypothetical protein
MSPLRAWTGSIAARDRRPHLRSPRWAARSAGSPSSSFSAMDGASCRILASSSPPRSPSTSRSHPHKSARPSAERPVRANLNLPTCPLVQAATKQKQAPRLRVRSPAVAWTAPSTGTFADLLGLEAPAAPLAGTRRLTGHFNRAWLRIFSPNASSLHPPHHHPSLSYHSAYHRGGSLGADHPPKNNFYFSSYNFLPKQTLTI